MIMSSNSALISQKPDQETPPQNLTKEMTLVKGEDECSNAISSITLLASSIEDADGIQSLLSAAALSYPLAYQPSITSPQSLSQMPRNYGSPQKRFGKPPKRKPRDHRPMYTQEEADAILYLRDSVGLSWKKVVEIWNLHFDPHTGKMWGPRTISGLQSHYYRMLGIEKSPGRTRRSSAPNPDIGLLKATNRRYWWVYGSSPEILKEVAVSTPGQLKVLLKRNIRRIKREAQREGRRQRKLTRRIADKESILHHSKALQDTLEEPKCSKIKKTCADDSDSDSSIGDSFDQNSISDVDGYDTSSVAPPPSSHTSIATTPPEGFDLEAQASQQPLEDSKNKYNILPPFQSLWGIADRGANKREANIVRWQDRVETLHRPERAKNRNPMAVANLLT